MAVPHLDMSIVSRGKGQSAVAAAAYQSGEKLYSEHDQKTKYYSEKQGIVATEILLPKNAPEEYKDRNTLWNSVEKAERQWNSQLARRIIIAIPREIPQEEHPRLLHEYCQKEFVDRGMCCDIAIHDKDGSNSNPHAHILLTLRPINEDGTWGDKSHKVYELDENGEKIKLESGEEKCHKVSTTGWDDQGNAEIWRHNWEELANEYLERAGSDVRLDMRSYVRQGKNQVPTVHMGPAVTNMERRGIQTDVGNLNRDIRSFNQHYLFVRKRIRLLKFWISNVSDKIDRLISSVKADVSGFVEWASLAGDGNKSKTEAMSPEEFKVFKEKQKAVIISNLEKGPIESVIRAYTGKRYEENKNSPDQRSEYNKDLQMINEPLEYVRVHHIKTVSDLDKRVSNLENAAKKIGSAAKYHDRRLKEISMIETKIEIMKSNQSIIDDYAKKKFKKTREAFYTKNKPEIDEYYKAKKYLEIHNKGVINNLLELEAEKKKLLSEKVDLDSKVTDIEKELDCLNKVKACVDYVLERKDDDGVEKNPELQMQNGIQDRIRRKQNQIKEEEQSKKDSKKRTIDIS